MPDEHDAPPPPQPATELPEAVPAATPEPAFASTPLNSLPPLNAPPQPEAPQPRFAMPPPPAQAHGYAQPAFAQGVPPQYAGANHYPAAAYPVRKPRSAWFWPVIILGLAAILGLTLWGIVKTAVGSDSTSNGTGFGADKIAVIDLDGVIVDADKVDAQLHKFADDSSVKAIILHINSPGGGAAASQEIYHEILSIRHDKHKPVIASVESVGASGAYYIATACDKIYANDASVVGSIGVIMEWTNYGDLMKWAKLKPVVIHAGELKDAGDPTRDMTPGEAAYFQSLVNNMYGQFIADVAAGRHTTAAQILPLATGQVWTGQQSLPMGLIDKVGGFHVALIDTARSVGITDEEPTIVRANTPKKGLAALLGGDSDDLFLPTPAKLLDRSPGFFFLWK